MISFLTPSERSRKISEWKWGKWKWESQKVELIFALRETMMKGWQRLMNLTFRAASPFFVVSRLKRTQKQLEKKLTFLRDIGALCNPRFGIDRTVGVIMERLRVFYGADCCLLVSLDAADGTYYSRRTNGLDPESAMQKSPLSPKLARIFLDFPSTHATTHNAQLSNPRTPLLQCYDVVAQQKIARKTPLSAKLSGLLEGNFVCVPLLHHGQELGRVYLTSDQRTFDQSDIEFIHQVVSHAVPILKNIELVDHLALDAAKEERLRIARDIHDSIIQPYIGLQMGIESLRQKVVLGENHLMPDIERLNQLCLSGTVELRSYVQQLKESRAREESLVATLGRLAAQFETATGIRVCIEALPDLQLHPRLAAEVLQMVSEGLSNIRRHTDSETAILRLSIDRGCFKLIIQNCNENVNFFATNAGEKSRIPGSESCSFTPVSLSERTWSLGGNIEVDVAQQGATVTIEIPL